MILYESGLRIEVYIIIECTTVHYFSPLFDDELTNTCLGDSIENTIVNAVHSVATIYLERVKTLYLYLVISKGKDAIWVLLVCENPIHKALIDGALKWTECLSVAIEYPIIQCGDVYIIRF